MHLSAEEFLQGISGFLGSYYIALAVMNAIAALHVWQRLGKGTLALFWTLVAVFF